MKDIRIEREKLRAYYEQNREREFSTMDNVHCPVASYVNENFPVDDLSVGSEMMHYYDQDEEGAYHVVAYEPWLVQHIHDIDQQGPSSELVVSMKRPGPITGARCLELLAELDTVEGSK